MKKVILKLLSDLQKIRQDYGIKKKELTFQLREDNLDYQRQCNLKEQLKELVARLDFIFDLQHYLQSMNNNKFFLSDFDKLSDILKQSSLTIREKGMFINKVIQDNFKVSLFEINDYTVIGDNSFEQLRLKYGMTKPQFYERLLKVANTNKKRFNEFEGELVNLLKLRKINHQKFVEDFRKISMLYLNLDSNSLKNIFNILENYGFTKDDYIALRLYLSVSKQMIQNEDEQKVVSNAKLNNKYSYIILSTLNKLANFEGCITIDEYRECAYACEFLGYSNEERDEILHSIIKYIDFCLAWEKYIAFSDNSILNVLNEVDRDYGESLIKVYSNNYEKYLYRRAMYEVRNNEELANVIQKIRVVRRQIEFEHENQKNGKQKLRELYFELRTKMLQPYKYELKKED